MKLLSISDRQFVSLKSPEVGVKFHDVDLVISCGDLPYYYLESLSDILHKPLFFVRGNHDPDKEYYSGGIRTFPRGCTDLHSRIVLWNNLLMAGVEGSLRYNNRGVYQYTQTEMWGHVLSLIPGLLLNRVMHGRFLDIFATHAPPWGIHDKDTPTHQGIQAFRWLIKRFQPKYHLHGHIHVYHDDVQTETQLGGTQVINTYGFREMDLKQN